MTTGMDRLVAAIKGERSDRIPVFCNLLDQGASELGIPLEEYYTNGEHVAEAQLRMLKRYGHDNVWSLFFVGKEAELLGCKKILYAKDGPPNVEDLVIKTHDDVARLEVPADVSAHPAFTEVAKCLRILKREVGGKVPICAHISATMTLPALLMGMEKWLGLLLMGPASVRDELLAKCHEFFVKEVAAYRNAGANIIVYANPFGSPEIVSMKFFREHSLPWIEKDVAAIGPAGVVYCCDMARINSVVETVLQRTRLGVYYLSPEDDIGEAKRIIAGRALTCGVINDIKMIGWTPEQTRQEVKRIIEVGMPGGKFLFGTGLMPIKIPQANIHAMLDAAYEFGSYENRPA